MADIVKLETYSSHSRLTFPSLQKQPLEVKTDATGFQIRLRDISLTDWGVAFGEESEFIKDLSKYSDHRLSGLTLKEESGDLILIGQWKFPVGLDAPANPKMETYEYVRDNKARGHFDFWLKPGKTVKESNVQKQKLREEKNQQRAESEAKQRQQRRIARAQSKKQTENLSDFCEEPLTEHNYIPIHFRPIREQIDFTQWFPKNRPDEGFIYSEAIGSGEEKTYVQLAHRLDEEGKFALVIKTIDFLTRDYPKTKYNDEMLLLKAAAFFKLGLTTDSDLVLKKLSSGTSRSNAVHQTMLYQANRALGDSSPLATFELFSKLQSRFPDSDLMWVFRLGVAESLSELQQTERAASEYEWLSKNSKRKDIQAIASFRMGDLFLDRREYSKALGRYFQSFKDFPMFSNQMISARLNYGESLFWSKQYVRAEEEFKKIIKEFGSNPNAWRATLRLAEIASYSGNLAESKKYYLETINRYPASVGSRISRMSLVPCGDHLGLSVDGIMRLIESARPGIKDDVEVSFTELERFFSFQEIRTIGIIAEPEAVFELAFKQLSGKLTEIHHNFIDRAIAAAFKKGIQDRVLKNDLIGAIHFFENYNKKVNEALVRSDSNNNYLIQMASEAAKNGFLNSAYQIVFYKDQIDARLSRDLASNDLTFDLDQKLEQSELSFLSAKILWLKNGLKNKSEIQKKLSKVIDDSPYSPARETMLGLIDEKEGKTVSALKHALMAETLISSESRAIEKNSYLTWIYKLQLKNNNKVSALGVLKQLEPQNNENITFDSTLIFSKMFDLPKPPIGSAYWYDRAEVESDLKKWKDAANSFQQIIKLDPTDDRARVQYVRAKYHSGEADQSGELANSLRNIIQTSKNEIWKKVASEILKTRELKSNAKEGKS